VRVITNAAISNEMGETQKKRVLSVIECQWCGLVHYSLWGEKWDCPICVPKAKANKRSFCLPGQTWHGCSRVFTQVRRLRRKRHGTVVFERRSYWVNNHLTAKFEKVVSLACHGTGRQDPGRIPGRIYRNLRRAGSRRGGDPTLIAAHLRIVRG